MGIANKKRSEATEQVRLMNWAKFYEKRLPGIRFALPCA